MASSRASGDRFPAETVEVLSCRGLRKIYSDPIGKRSVTALDGIDWEIQAGERWALVGRSGGGKSTLGRCLALDERPDAGDLRVLGESGWAVSPSRRRWLRRSIQWIPQDPAEALDPRFSVLRAAAQPLEILGPMGFQGRRRRAEHRDRVAETLEAVGLDTGLLDRPVPTLSGGQKRRLVIARALLAEPRVLVLDESLAGLDLALQGQLVELLDRLHRRLGLALITISHDLQTIPRLADQLLVLDHGRVVERSTPEALLEAPRHAASRALVAAFDGLALPAGRPEGRG